MRVRIYRTFLSQDQDFDDTFYVEIFKVGSNEIHYIAKTLNSVKYIYYFLLSCLERSGTKNITIPLLLGHLA